MRVATSRATSILFSNSSRSNDQTASNLDQSLKLSEKSDKLHRDIGKLLYAIAEEAQLEIIRKGNQFVEDLEDWRTVRTEEYWWVDTSHGRRPRSTYEKLEFIRYYVNKGIPK